MAVSGGVSRNKLARGHSSPRERDSALLAVELGNQTIDVLAAEGELVVVGVLDTQDLPLVLVGCVKHDNDVGGVLGADDGALVASLDEPFGPACLGLLFLITLESGRLHGC